MHGVIFKGAVGNKEKRVTQVLPLVTNSKIEAEYADFFTAFFADGGDYMRYVTVTSGSDEILKIEKKMYKVGVIVTVQYEALRKMLEEKGIVKKVEPRFLKKKQMKKIVLIAAFLLLVSGAGFAKAKKPTIMVIPSDVWCNQNGYMSSFDNQGQVEKYPNYEAALQSSSDLTLAINKIGEMMSERGFPLKDLSACLKAVNTTRRSIR